MTIGEIIHALRKKAGYSQVTLAERCAISQTYLSQIEKDKRDPHLSTLRVICKNLNIPLPLLFFFTIDANDVPSKKRQAFDTLYPSIKQLLTTVFEIDPETK